MDKLFQSLFQLQTKLREATVPSAAIGGLAVTIWGEPRLTRDVDVRVLLERDQAPYLLELLQTDYTSLIPEPEQTLRQMGFVFMQDGAGCRVDLLLTDTPFDAQVIARARQVTVKPDLEVVVCTPEDLIIYKMISTRPRDQEDVKGIVRRQRTVLDEPYIVDWLQQFEQALDDSTLVESYRRISRT